MNWLKYIPFATSLAKLGISALLAKNTSIDKETRAVMTAAAIAELKGVK